ncbi:hypothetical protein OG393_21010 [Streptomyces sp. NBC_01216]|uniref:VG15 protein n=1 Tax=Streptomyces sp. NBC_01216 TaxID=2903778 RepID=UPI002E0FB471|nr:hypothetical protein OG393_21010 [Streptomyces sp. NBC_01216]
MSPSPDAQDHVEARKRLAEATVRATHAVWRDIDRDNIYSSWLLLLGRLLAIVSGGQLAAASSTNLWLRQLLGLPPPEYPEERLVPSSLVGVDGAGRPLAAVLMAPMWSALRLVAQGRPVAQSMAHGQALLDVIVRTAVADTGRAADQVGMVARRDVTTYVRVPNAGACSRCLVLAGIRVGGVSTAFQRHPNCHCGMEPVTSSSRPEPFDAKDLYDEMSPAQRRKTFGEAGMKAIDAGADIAQVVNARRGMSSASVFGKKLLVTSEGVTSRGLAGKRLKNLEKVPGQRYRVSQTPRLMPEEIFRLADDREHAIRLLRTHSYIV